MQEVIMIDDNSNLTFMWLNVTHTNIYLKTTCLCCIVCYDDFTITSATLTKNILNLCLILTVFAFSVYPCIKFQQKKKENSSFKNVVKYSELNKNLYEVHHQQEKSINPTRFSCYTIDYSQKQLLPNITQVPPATLNGYFSIRGAL